MSDDILSQLEAVLTLARTDPHLTDAEKIELLESTSRKLLQSMATERERADQAEFRATILQAQLGGWEAACAAQVEAIHQAVTVLRWLDIQGGLGQLKHEQIKAQIAALERVAETNAGQLLLQRLAQADAERDQWRSIRADETKELRRIAESAGVVFESSRDQDGFEHWAWRYGSEYAPGSVAEGGAAFGALRWICAEFRRQRSA